MISIVRRLVASNDGMSLEDNCSVFKTHRRQWSAFRCAVLQYKCHSRLSSSSYFSWNAWMYSKTYKYRINV